MLGGVAGVEVKAYDAMVGDVKALASAGAVMWMDPTKVSWALYQAAKPASTPTDTGVCVWGGGCSMTGGQGGGGAVAWQMGRRGL